MTSAAVRKKPAKTVSAVPTTPPAAIAPAVLAYFEASKLALASLKEKVAELVLEAAEGVEGGSERVAQIFWKRRRMEFELEAQADAHALAVRRDAEAYSSWKSAVMGLDPQVLIAGISPKNCPDLCSENGCIVTSFGACGHPSKAGGLPPALRSNDSVRLVYRAAREAVTAQIRAEQDA